MFSRKVLDSVIVAVLLAIAVATAMFVSTYTAKGHDAYHGVKRPDGSGVSCCGDQDKGGDCRAAIPVTKDGQTRIDGVLWDSKKVVPSHDHRYHVCEKHGQLFCILVPAGV